MPRVATSSLQPNLNPHDAHQVYNGLDCCVTLEVYHALKAELDASPDPSPRLIYDFERGMQAPALYMMERGWAIDPYYRRVAIDELEKRRTRIEYVLDRYAHAIWGRGLNPQSPKQMKEFFYYDPKGLKLPEQYKVFKGVRTVSTDRESLEKLQAYFYAVPIILAILALRDVAKKLSVLKSEVDDDNRMRTSYNVAGTETGRWSSSSNVRGGGTNLQNITPELRRPFVSDPGWKLCYLDKEQAESRVVGLLVWQIMGDPSYIDACESGDLHTTVARLVWPNLDWKGDKKHDREIADKIFYRQFSYRDMAKRGGHGTNYYGTPRTMARHLKVEERVMADFQSAYFRAFSGIPNWHIWDAKQLGLHQSLTTPLGRRRHFFGRPGDDATLREAIAYVPQSVVGDILNVALWRVWKYMPEVELLGQIHDAIVFQYPEKLETQVIPRALELTTIPITVTCIAKDSPLFGQQRTLNIPSECKIGWNWAEDVIKTSTGKKVPNPDGLIKWKGEPDARQRTKGLDRVIS